MKNIYVCGCFQNKFEKKTNDEIFNSIIDDRSIIYIKLDENVFICCRKIIDFCYKLNRCYFFERTCSTRLFGMCANCFHLLKFGFRDVCAVCTVPLQEKLFPFLIKIR